MISYPPPPPKQSYLLKLITLIEKPSKLKKIIWKLQREKKKRLILFDTHTHVRLLDFEFLAAKSADYIEELYTEFLSHE